YVAAISSGGFEPGSYSYALQVGPGQVGQTLRLRLRAVDAHGAQAQTPEVRVNVLPDQPPQVVLSGPAEGSHLVAGLPIELRADATDDVGVQRVDFYVDGRLIGSDASAPYAYLYATNGAVRDAQPMTLAAIAIDTQNKQTRSADVHVTLGKDDQKPVVNIVAPVV